MNKFVTTALAVAAVGTASRAEPRDSEWLELDREINSLATAVPATGTIGGWAVLLRSTYTYSSDYLAMLNPPNEDVSGFKMEDVRFSAWGEVDDYGWRVSYNFHGLNSTSSDLLEDAYAYWLCGDYFTATMGRFRPHVFRSNFVYEENQLFIHRTHLGASFDWYDEGFGARGDYEEFSWYLEVLNGENDQGSDHFWSGRGEYHWNGGAGDYEGAFGHGDDPMGTFGFVYAIDDTAGAAGSDAMLWGLDANGTAGPIGWGGEVAFLDKDYNSDTNALHTGPKWTGVFDGLDFDSTDGGGVTDDSTPFALTASYMINQDFEAAIRYQDFDNFLDETAITLALIWYQSGKCAKWNFEVSDISTDMLDSMGGSADTTVFQAGLSLGSSL